MTLIDAKVLVAFRWTQFATAALDVRARGDAIPDAYLAGLARELSCAVATFDRDFRRFAGVRMVEPVG